MALALPTAGGSIARANPVSATPIARANPVSATPIAGGVNVANPTNNVATIRTTPAAIVAQAAAIAAPITSPVAATRSASSAAVEQTQATATPAESSTASWLTTVLGTDVSAIGNSSIVQDGNDGGAIADQVHVGDYALDQQKDGTFDLLDPSSGQVGATSSTIAGAFAAFNSQFGTSIADFINPNLPTNPGGPADVAGTAANLAGNPASSNYATQPGTAIATSTPATADSSTGADPTTQALLNALAGGSGLSGGGGDGTSPTLPSYAAAPVIPGTASTTTTNAPTTSVWVIVALLVVGVIGYIWWKKHLAKATGRAEGEGAHDAAVGKKQNIFERLF